MSRTRRRMGAEHLYNYKQQRFPDPYPGKGLHDSEARLYHTDGYPHPSSPPRAFVRLFNRRIDGYNSRMLRRWLHDPTFDPVFNAKTFHRAQWAWN